MESKKWLTLILALIALIGSLEYMPRNVLLKVAIPSNASYPLNKGPTGTSMLWDHLHREGYKTVITYGFSGLPKLDGYHDLVFLDIGGQPGSSPKEAFDIIKHAYNQGLRVHFILLDELPSPLVWNLTVNATRFICGVDPLPLKGILNNSVNIINIFVNNENYRLPTGYTGYIEYSGSPIATPGEPKLPLELNGFTAIASAWPYPQPPYEGDWYIAGIECSSERGSVLIIADSTIATNLEARSRPDSLRILSMLIDERVESPSSTIVVVDEELYVNPGKGSLQLILSLHPSVLLLAFSRVYSSVEPIVINGLMSRKMGSLMLAALAAVLAGSTIYASSLISKEKGEFKKRRTRTRFRLPLSPGSWQELVSVCGKVDQLRLLGISDEKTLGIVMDLVERTQGRCRRASKSRLLRYIPLWGESIRRVREEMALALSISGVYSYEEAVKIMEGD